MVLREKRELRKKEVGDRLLKHSLILACMSAMRDNTQMHLVGGTVEISAETALSLASMELANDDQ